MVGLMTRVLTDEEKAALRIAIKNSNYLQYGHDGPSRISWKVGPKKKVVVISFSDKRFPLVAYADKLLQVLDHATELRQFIEENRDNLRWPPKFSRAEYALRKRLMKNLRLSEEEVDDVLHGDEGTPDGSVAE